VIAYRFGVVERPKFKFPGEQRREKAND